MNHVLLSAVLLATLPPLALRPAITQAAPNGAAPVAAAAGATSNIEPAAVAVYDSAIAALKSANALSLRYESKETVKGAVSSESGTLQWKRPNLLRAQSSGERPRLVLSNGTSIYVSTGENVFRQIEQSGALEPEYFRHGLPGGLGMILTNLLFGENPLRTDGEHEERSSGSRVWCRVLPSERIGDTDCVVLRRTVQMQSTPGRATRLETTIWFNASDYLLRRVRMAATGSFGNADIVDDVTDIRVNPQMEPGTFTWKLPAGARIATEEDQETYWSPALVRGAKPFPLSGRDLNGKPVSLDKYKGKVVLLDFWATWCGPCVAEMPNVIRNYKQFHGRGFEIIGISLDNDRKALNDFIKSRKITWPQLFDGKGWESANAKRYQVQAIPFSLLIGRDGRIAAVNPTGPELQREIQKALGPAGKTTNR